MLLFQQSEATAAQRRVPIHLVDQTDGITPETGEAAGQPQLSKNGAAFANTTATLTAVGNGLYYVELTAAELDTLGFIAVRFDSANTAEAQVIGQVVPWDPYDATRMGLTALPNANAEAAGGLYTRGTGAGQINQTTNGRVDTDVMSMATNVISSSVLDTTAVNEIADGVWDESLAAHTTSDTSGHVLNILTQDAVTLNGTVHIDSVFGQIFDVGTAWTFDRTTDSLEAIRDRGDAAWTTGAGGSPPTTLQNTTTTVTSQTVHVLAAGSSDDGAYVGATVIFTDQATSAQKAVGICSAYTGSTKTLTLAADPGVFTIATGDTVDIIAASPALPSAPAEASGGLYTQGTGAGQINQSNNGRIDTDVQSLAASSITAASIATDAITAAKIAANAIGASELATDAIGDAQIATGAIASTAFAAGAIDAAAIAANAIGASELATDAVAEIADGVWDEARSGHTTAGTFGQGVASVQGDVTGNVDGSVNSVTTRVTANTDQINGVAAAAAQLALSADTVMNGTASGTPTTTTMVSDIGVTVDDQYNGRTIIFADDTTTAALRDQATDITGCTAATNTLTFTALTTAPVSGDTFVIV